MGESTGLGKSVLWLALPPIYCVTWSGSTPLAMLLFPPALSSLLASGLGVPVTVGSAILERVCLERSVGLSCWYVMSWDLLG